MRRLLRSFVHAGRGIYFALKQERNFQMEAVGTLLVVLVMLWLPLTKIENVILIVAITSVLSVELVNTAIERMMDILKPRVHPYARVIKDMMAGAVLIVSLGALLVGATIVVPYFIP